MRNLPDKAFDIEIDDDNRHAWNSAIHEASKISKV